MGKTALSGPVYGAKTLLFQSAVEAGIVSTAAVVMGSVVVPTGEEWYVCNVQGHRRSTGSTALVISLLDDSTSIATVAITSSLANSRGSTVIAATSGEYEGLLVATGSSLTLSLTGANSSAAALTSSGVSAYVYGYIRWLASTARTE